MIDVEAGSEAGLAIVRIMDRGIGVPAQYARGGSIFEISLPLAEEVSPGKPAGDKPQGAEER